MFLVICFIVIPFTVLTSPKKAEARCVPFTVPPLPDPFSVPVHTSKSSTQDQADKLQNASDWFKTCILDGLATLIAKTIIKSLTQSIVQWINSGFKGNPSFVQDTGAFFGDIADKVAGQTIERAAPFLCSPFRLNVTLALALQATNGGESSSCTLTNVENNFSNFLSSGINVNVSANLNANTSNYWDNWFNITQNPQNNPYGAMMIAQAKISSNVQNSQAKYQKQLDWGRGFLSFESCPSTVGPRSAGTPSAESIITGAVALPGVPSQSGGASGSNNRGPTGPAGPRGSFNITDPSNSSLASIGSLGLLDSIFGNTSGDDLVAQAQGFRRNSDGSYTPYDARSTGQVLTNGLSRGSSQVNPNTLTAANINSRGQILDSNKAPIYGTYAGENGCITQTPGAVIESQLEHVLGSDLRGLEIAQSIDQIVAALVGQLVNQVMGGLRGLAGAGSSGSSGSSGGYDYQRAINAAAGAGAKIPDLPLTGACVPNKQSAEIGQTVTWNAYVPDYNGAVTYRWFDSENNSYGSQSSATTSYSTTGSKTLNVKVTTASDPQGQVITCSPVQIGNSIITNSVPTVSCAVSPSTVSLSSPVAVTWQAVAIGGVPPFIYTWQGDENLTGTGQSIVKTYATASTTPKAAIVYVTSADGETYSHTCTSGVLVTP